MQSSSATCPVCPRHCRLGEGQTGVCGARVCRKGVVVCENYGRLTSVALDPVEKKPLAVWMPGSYVLSVGSYGCNLSCPFCQNHEIAHARADSVGWRVAEPEELVDSADKLRSRGNVGIAFTYNEPLVGWEFVRDTAQLAHERGLKVVVVTNGVVSPGVWSRLLPLVDACNIDLKTDSNESYTWLGARAFDTVVDTIRVSAACPTCHVEVTTLCVPGFVDDRSIERLARVLASIDPSIPYHVAQYVPCYRMAQVRALPDAIVRSYADIARTWLDRVYTGNM